MNSATNSILKAFYHSDVLHRLKHSLAYTKLRMCRYEKVFSTELLFILIKISHQQLGWVQKPCTNINLFFLDFYLEMEQKFTERGKITLQDLTSINCGDSSKLHIFNTACLPNNQRVGGGFDPKGYKIVKCGGSLKLTTRSNFRPDYCDKMFKTHDEEQRRSQLTFSTILTNHKRRIFGTIRRF